MRLTTSLLPILAVSLALSSGCAGPEKKLGRGLNNLTEVTRFGDLQRAMEQSYLYDGADTAYTTGVVRGFSKSFARTVLGAYEVATFPIPSYDPILTPFIPARPQFTDNYRPAIIADPMFMPDVNMGFGTGDVMPFVPGSRFRIFTD